VTVDGAFSNLRYFRDLGGRERFFHTFDLFYDAGRFAWPSERCDSLYSSGSYWQAQFTELSKGLFRVVIKNCLDSAVT
jgi:hypothetical protein